MVGAQKICSITNIFLRIVIGFCLDGNTCHQECWCWTLCCVSPLWWRHFTEVLELPHCMCAVIYSNFSLPLYFNDLIFLLKDRKAMACGPFRIELGRTAQYYFFQSSGFFAVRINGMLNVVTAEGCNTSLGGDLRWLSHCVEQSVPELVSYLYK